MNVDEGDDSIDPTKLHFEYEYLDITKDDYNNHHLHFYISRQTRERDTQESRESPEREILKRDDQAIKDVVRM